jgi:hypothetical protein
MAMRPWTDNVRYYEFTPVTIHYDLQLDAFFIARADVRSPAHPHRLGLVVAVTAADLRENRLTVQDGIRLGQTVLDRLLEQHRGVVDSLDASSVRVFDLAGVRIR